MKLSQARKLAGELLQTHNPDCGFEFCHGYSRLGYYSPRKNKIHISIEVVEYNKEWLVRDILLHEIAHSLTRGHKHDNVFRAKCRELGCNPLSRTSEIVKLPPKRYRYECPNCGLVVYRMSKNYRLACSRCCRLYARNQYSRKYTFNISENENYKRI